MNLDLIAGPKNEKYLQNSGCSPRTINNRLSAISSLFNHLIDKQVAKVNVAQGVGRMPVNADRVEAKVMTPDGTLAVMVF